MTDKASENLKAAAALIRTHGWCQGAYRGKKGSYCLLGAVDMIVDLNGEEKTYDVLFERAMKKLGTQFVTRWNDKPGRTMDEVLDFLEKE